MKANTNKLEIVALALTGGFLAIFILIAFIKEGTGDSGDSIEHYLISRFAFIHPELYLHHWGKPVFTLLSSPFSQLGFTGMKIFNCLVAALTGYFTIKIAVRLRILYCYPPPDPLPAGREGEKVNSNLPPPFSKGGGKGGYPPPRYLVIFFLFAAPVYFKYIFSGMTEHLLGLALILAVYLMLKRQITLSVLIVSFMPFMRSEGLILAGVFALYLFVKKQYRYLPLLLVGHFCYSIAGYFYFRDFLWVFNRIPYLNLDSWYGSGHWPDFIFKLYYVIGLPLFAMLILGLGWMAVKLFRKRQVNDHPNFTEELILIYGSFIAFFLAHTAFWALGIFNSMGLGRVLNSVVPLTALIGMRGLEWITSTRFHWRNRIISYGILLFIIVFPFIGNPASLKWDKDLDLSADQKLIQEVLPGISKGSSGSLYLYSHPYIGMQLGIDPFNPSKRGKIAAIKDPQHLPQNTVIVWDSWFSPIEEGYTFENLSTYDFLALDTLCISREDTAKKIAIFVMKDSGIP
ncbi:MAG: hypothetical protein PHD61_01165 [Bacteroidales bacterium]|nr:hypothetical protein [Lentimicrobiaceae bacterium]MDD5693902.1 hypothetical protein [Bacteroidales bacterium]